MLWDYFTGIVHLYLTILLLVFTPQFIVHVFSVSCFYFTVSVFLLYHVLFGCLVRNK